MKADNKKTQKYTNTVRQNYPGILIVCILTAYALLLTGCTNWEKKYQALNVEHQNLKGLLDRERGEKGQLADKVSQSQQTLEELQKKIAQRRQTPAEATGFGQGYNVAFDSSAGTITVTLPNAILFDSGKAELKRAANAKLDHIRSVLNQKYRNRQIDVVGHTDSDPIKKSKWKDNWELSAQRALAVVRYLSTKGIAKNRIRAVGCGAARAVASNKTASGKAKNRRVEIVVHIK